MKSRFTFAGQSSSDFFMTIEYIPGYSTGRKNVNTYTVPGRSGALIRDEETYENYTQPYDVWVKAPPGTVTHQAARKVANWLTGVKGYQRLEDTYDPDIYRMAYFIGPMDFDNWFFKYGRATLEFNCMPQRWLKSGEFPQDISDGQILINDWKPALPLIQIAGSGVGTLVIGDYTVGISNIPADGLTIDCDSQNAYTGQTNQNNLITLTNGFPVLQPGENDISFEDGITSVKITPRWWCV